MKKTTILILVLVLMVPFIFADDNLFCVNDIVRINCHIGTMQNNITLMNSSDVPFANLTTSQNYLGGWNASYNFTTVGYYQARCNLDDTTQGFDIVDYCQKNIDTNIDAIQEDIGDPSGSGTTLYTLINQIYNWIQTNIVNRVGVYVG